MYNYDKYHNMLMISKYSKQWAMTSPNYLSFTTNISKLISSHFFSSHSPTITIYRICYT